jgi:type I restriction enzyme S subunit
MSNQLPQGWATATLAEIAEINPRHPKGLDDATVVTFVPMVGVSVSKPDFQFTQERPLGEVRKGFVPFAEGDVLFAKITPCMENGKGAVARGLRNKLGYGTTELHVIRPLAGIQPEYIYRFLAQDRVRRAAKENFTGTAGQARVPVSFIKELEIPLAPAGEQRRIVAKLEKLLGNVDSCQQRLAKIPVLLKRFRQSVLAAACSGRLTADWRGENPRVESALDFLRRIDVERRATFEDSVCRSKASQQSLPKRPYWLTYKVSCCERRGEIPDDWTTCPVGFLCDCIVPGRDKPKSFTGSIPWVTLPDLLSLEISRSESGLGLTESEIAQVNARIIPPQSVVMSCIGRFGLSAVVNCNLVVNQQLHAFLPSPAILPKYLACHIPTLRSYMDEIATSTTIAYLNKENCNSIPINLPPLAEQREIVRRVETLLALAYQIEGRYTKAKAYVDKLTPSLLAKAFRGELVPQDPDDESAEKLLKRLRVPNKK